MAKKKRNTSYRNTNQPEGSGKKAIVISNESKKKLEPTSSRVKSSRTALSSEPMLFNKQHYILMGVGIALMFLGLMLMSGGAQAPNEWNPDEVYSVRRTVLAPIIMLIGLGVELYAIFKK